MATDLSGFQLLDLLFCLLPALGELPLLGCMGVRDLLEGLPSLSWYPQCLVH